MEAIITSKAPAPIGPYSQAVKHDNTLYISGQIAINPATSELEMGTIQEETTLVMKNMEAILTEAGFEFGNVAKCTILLSDMSLFVEVNEIYGKCFANDCPPARETFAVKGLPKGVNVEISAIAVK
jgi:2-iminobutanoate/2-iminopropanoate deaminase